MNRHLKKIKKYAALWLSIAMLAGSVYINGDESSLATENVGGVAEDSLATTTGNENTEADGSDTVKTVRATASDLLDEVEDGEVIDDTSTDSNAVIDGEVEDATESDAILDGEIATLANALLSIATSSNIVNPNAASFLRLDSSITGSIATPSDFAIGKAGTKTMKIAYLFDFQDIAEGDRSSIGAEIVIPKGFDVDESTIETDSNWTTTVTTNDDGDNLIIFKNIGNLTTLRQTLVIVQDAQYLINHLSERHIYNFQSKFYNNYGNENQALVVKNDGDEATDSFTFEADNTTPTWTVDPVCNNETWKPRDILGRILPYAKRNYYTQSANDTEYTRNLSNQSSDNYKASFSYDNKFMIVKYTKGQGYISDDTIFRFMTETLPVYTNQGIQKYQIIVNYTDINGNIINIINNTISDKTEIYNSFMVNNGEYVFKAALIANLYTGDNVKQFKTQNDSTISEILYNAGTFEIKVMPYLYYNKVFYEQDWDNLIFTSAYSTQVTAKNNESGDMTTFEGAPIKVEIVNGTEDQEVTSVSALTADNVKLLQYGTTDTYNDISGQSIKFFLKSQTYPDWKVYDNFTYTIEYEESSGNYKEALYPIKLTSLRTNADYGLTYKIYIKNATDDSQRIVTILGMKNNTQEYDYTPDENETIIGKGLATWDGTTGDYKLSETEYVPKIEIIKTKLSASYIRNTYTDGILFASATLRVQHQKIDGSGEDIPSGTNVNVVTTVKTDDHIWKEHIQTATTMHSQDNLELIKKDSDLTMQVNNAKKDNGILGIYTLKKYPDTMSYDKNDPPVVVLSGDGATLTDRISAMNQRLLYIVDQNDNIIDVTDNGDIKASDYTVDTAIYYSEIFGKDKEKVVRKNKNATNNTNAYRNSVYNWSDECYDNKLYNLTTLYDALGIRYAKKLVISQDYINDWQVTAESGETRSMYFYANQIKPDYLNYDNLISIDGKDNTESVQLTYMSELYCKASDWLNKSATDSNAGRHGGETSQTQAATCIAYGGRDVMGVGKYPFTIATAVVNTKSGNVVNYNNGGNVIAKIYTLFNETKSNGYIDYDNVEYDFLGTDPQLLSITTGVGVYSGYSSSMYQLDIEYTTSDGQTHNYYDKLFYTSSSSSSYAYIPLEIEDGTYITGIKVRPSSDDYIYSKMADSYYMQPGLPQVTLCLSDAKGAVPSNYPSSGNKIGYQGNVLSGRIYDQLDVKCTISYNDIFGNEFSELVEGKSAYITKSTSKLQYTETIINSSDTTKYKVEYSASSVNTGDVINVKFCPAAFTWTNINYCSDLKLRPVFYYAINKDFTPDTTNIEGAPAGTSIVFYPAGIGNGFSGSEDYGYLVMDFGNVEDDSLPDKTLKSLVGLTGNTSRYGWIFGPYTIPLITSYEAREGDKTPILHMWTDVPHDSGRDGGTGNPLADIELYESACKSGAPNIIDSTGAAISNVKTNSSGSPIMLYADLTSATGAQIAVNSRAVSGIVPYVTESATDGFSQDAVKSRDYIELDKTKGLFGNKIYAVGDATNITTDFDIYVPIAKKGESNLADGGTLSEVSDYSLDFVNIDISELKKAENAEGAVVYFTTTTNPGSGGFASMKDASWSTTTPSDATQITGIKIHMDKLMPGTTVPFYIRYKLHEDKSVVGTQTAYQTFYGDYKLNGVSPFIEGGVDKGYTNPTVEEYILEDMAITGFVWDETGKTPNSVYDSGSDKTPEGIVLKLYDENGAEVAQTNTSDLSSNEKFKTAAEGKYELIAPCDGKYTVELIKPDDGESWGLVKKKIGTNANIYSVGNQSTFKTDVLELKANYAQKKFTLANINFGMYTQVKLDMDNANTWVHVGDVATASIAFVGDQISIGTNPIARFASASDASVAKVIDNNNNTATITGLKAGKTYADVRFTDLYGNYIIGRANIVTYIRVRYDAKANGGSGDTEDSNIYYAASGSNAYKVLGNSKVKPPAGYNFSGWSTKKNSTKDNFDRKVGKTYSIELTDMTKDLTLYAIYQPKEGIEYRIEYYRQKAGSPTDVLGSYEHYAAGDRIATGSTAEKVKAPEGYLTEFADVYKFNSTMSNPELEKLIEVDSEGNGITVVKLYYDIDYKDINWYDDLEQEPPIKKAIASKYGKWPKKEQVFTFTMEGNNGAPLPSNTTATLSSADILNSDGAKLGIDFGNITYSLKDAGKTYTYTIKEEVLEGGFKDYDPDKTAASDGYKMTIKIDIDGTKLKKTVIYGSSSSEADASTDGIVITNTYTEMYEPIKWLDGDESQQNLPIKKAITSKYGKLPKDEQVFTFTMEGSKGAPLPDNTKATLSSANILSSDDAKLGINFGNIEFDTDDLGKTYTYTIKEEVPEGGIKDYDVDKTAAGNGYKMTVKIATDSNTNTLTKEVTYSDGESDNKDGIVITNTYIATYDPIQWYDDGDDRGDDGDIEQDPPIKKAIVPAKSGGKLPTTEQEFVFTMTGRNGAPLPPAREGETTYDPSKNMLIATLSTNEALKGIEFGNISFDYDDAGNTYEYIIQEVSQDIKNYTFDDVATGNGYKMTVKIATNSDTLTKEVTYGSVDGATTDRVTDDGIVITNTYTTSSSSGGGGGSSGGETGKHAVDKTDTNPNTDQNNGDDIIFVEPKPGDKTDDNANHKYKYKLWDFLPKTGEERAMSFILLSMLALVAIFGMAIFKKKDK